MRWAAGADLGRLIGRDPPQQRTPQASQNRLYGTCKRSRSGIDFHEMAKRTPPINPVKFDARKKLLALEKFAETGAPVEAAAAAGVSRRTLDRHRDEDPEFGEQWAVAQQRYVELLEEAARKRAVDGVVEEKYGPTGALASKITRYSDGLLTLLLKANAPKKYRENQRVEVHSTGSIDHKHRIDPAKLSPDQKDAMRRLLRPSSPEIEVDVSE